MVRRNPKLISVRSISTQLVKKNPLTPAAAKESQYYSPTAGSGLCLFALYTEQVIFRGQPKVVFHFTTCLSRSLVAVQSNPDDL